MAQLHRDVVGLDYAVGMCFVKGTCRSKTPCSSRAKRDRGCAINVQMLGAILQPSSDVKFLDERGLFLPSMTGWQ